MFPPAPLSPPVEGDPGLPGGDAVPEHAAGWYPDPWQRHEVRFHDGDVWSEHVADGGLTSIDSVPVADLPRSRPQPPVAAPPSDPVGARVLDAARGRGDAGSTAPIDAPLLLVDLEPGADGRRVLRDPEDRPAGTIHHARASVLTRVGRALVSSPSAAITRLDVRDADGAVAVSLRRPGRRTARRVEVRVAGRAVGAVEVVSLRGGLTASVRHGEVELGELRADTDGVHGLTVTDAEGARSARLTSVWDVPGARHNLPPGVWLLDRRPPAGVEVPPEVAALLLGAVLAPALLLPPPPPTTDR